MATGNWPIAELFAHDIHRAIEEVIKVDQTDAATVAGEIREYVVTDKICDAYSRLLERYDETFNQPHEGIGIWISGFFGSGKSSFAKTLGYILENRDLLGTKAVDLFLNRLPGAGADKIRLHLTQIAKRIPTSAIIFNVATDQAAKTGSEKITALMYRALLRNLGYAEDFTFAELEINLEAAGKLDQFEGCYATIYKRPWRKGRALIVTAKNEASRVLHELDPATYPAADSWARSIANLDVSTSPNKLAERVFELMNRRQQGRSVVFVIDEVGQYVARSTDKMLDLQGVVEALGRVGRGKAWVVVTSQERLEEIVSSLDQARIELARLRDRFPEPLRVDLVAADISEVTSLRVLAKKAEVKPQLEQLYESVKGQLAAYTKLEGTARYPMLNAGDFVRLYPFLPYQIDLVVDVISGLRLQAGGSTHTGGSSRTIIKLAQQAIISPQAGLGTGNVGALVTLDMVYDLIGQFIHPDRRADIEKIVRDYPAAEHPLVAKVSKSICLLEYVKNVKRSSQTLAAVLHSAVGAPSLLPAVEQALGTLKDGQWIEEAEGGWRLLSPQGKQWAIDRQKLPEPKEHERIRYQKELLEELLRGVKDYKHLGHRTFRPAIKFAGDALTAGDVEVELILVEEARWEAARKQALEQSRDCKTVYWVAPTEATLDKELEQFHRSTLMIENNKREAKQKGLQDQLEAEGRRKERHAIDAKNRLTAALMSGETYFGGVRREAVSLADQLADVLQKLFASVVPELYPKFELAAVQIKEGDILRIIDDKSLGGLPEVFHTGGGRLGLIAREGGQYKPNPGAEVAAEVFAYIKRNYRPQDRVMGKQILLHFSGLSYGWDPEPVRAATATLLRAGKLEIMADGQRIQSHTDQGARSVFASLPGFRSASFAPKSGGIAWEEQVSAAQLLRRVYGENVAFEDQGAIVEAVRRLREQEQVAVFLVQSGLLQAGLAGRERLQQYLNTLSNIAGQSTDDLIKSLLASGEGMEAGHRLVLRLKSELISDTTAAINSAQQALRVAWPILSTRSEGESVRAAAERLQANLGSEHWYEALPAIKSDRSDLARAYLAIYQQAYQARAAAYAAAIELVKGHPQWTSLTEAQQQTVLAALQSRAGAGGAWSEDALPASPSVQELEAHRQVVGQVQAQAIFEVERLTSEKEIKRVKVSQFLSGGIEDVQTLEQALSRLRDHCAMLLNDNVKVILE